MPRVAVIMPSFNHEKYVAQAIESVLSQTYQDFELVITDDGSTDGTVSVVRQFTDRRIKLFTLERNRGAPVACAHCVAHTDAEYLAMLSSDDAFMADKLGKQVRFLDEHPDVWAVFSYAQIIDENGDEFRDTNHFYYKVFDQPNRSRHEWLNHFFYKGNCLCHPSVLARRECYTTLAPPDPRYSQLGDLRRWIKVCLSHDIHVLPERLTKFRVRSGSANASGAQPEAQRRTHVEYVHILKEFLSIETTEELLQIFPDASRYGTRVERELIPFVVAMLALDIEGMYQLNHNFAINVLFELLGSKEMSERLERELGFGSSEFVRLAGRYDFYNVQELVDREAQLAYRTEELACRTEQLAYLERYYGQLRFRLVEQANRVLRRIPGVHRLAKQSAELGAGVLSRRAGSGIGCDEISSGGKGAETAD